MFAIEIGELVVISKVPRLKVMLALTVSPEAMDAMTTRLSVPSGPPSATLITPVSGLIVVQVSPPVIAKLS